MNFDIHKTERFESTTMYNADKTPVRVRRNGKTKTWKRSPEKFRIPVKHGLRTCFYITEQNSNNWRAST